MRKDDARLRREDPRVSLFLRIDETGELLGTFKKPRKGNGRHHEIWTYDLNKQGNAAKIAVTGGQADGKDGVFACANHASF